MKLTKEQYKQRKDLPILKAHQWFGNDKLDEILKDYDYFNEDGTMFYVFEKVRESRSLFFQRLSNYERKK